ncbi:hypothetical protein RO1_36160 [Roseburia intestinalis XB6B4]|uniref:Uncharacterized protein n=1 Tax=Roseburia intestinalis XB6B4 TaxID=718255 RepID=D4L2M9_9FIRM|nr:hypothetical protein RO1_36160 [Roseburia intestinalis XB6B4]
MFQFFSSLLYHKFFKIKRYSLVKSSYE